MDQGYFDFKEEIDENEDLDFNKLIECPHCHKLIPHDSVLCLYCGESVSFGNKSSKWVMWIVIFVIIALLAIIIFQ